MESTKIQVSYIRCMWSGVHGVHLEFLRSIWSPGGFQMEFGHNLGGLYHAPLFHMESMWNLCGIHVVPHGICSFHMEYVLAEISPILMIFFHLYSTWNGVDSMWIPPFHMEFPHGIHVESFTWIPSHFHVDSMWIPCPSMKLFIKINTTCRLFWNTNGYFKISRRVSSRSKMKYCWHSGIRATICFHHFNLGGSHKSYDFTLSFKSKLIFWVLNLIPWFFVIKRFIDIQSSFSCILRITIGVCGILCHKICSAHCIGRFFSFEANLSI